MNVTQSAAPHDECELPKGFEQAPAMHAMQQMRAINATLRATLASFSAPPLPFGQFLHIYTHPELGALDCHLEGERAEPENGLPEVVTLHAAYLRGIDIADRLLPAEVRSIELSASTGAKQQKREHIPAEAEMVGSMLDAESLEQGEPR